jgi:hypothetical protein
MQRQALAIGISEAVEHEAVLDRGDHRLGDFGQRLVVLGQPTPAEPAEPELLRAVARLLVAHPA